MYDRLPPQNLDAERAVLGAILLDGRILPEIAAIVEVADFYRDAHQIIYRAMLDLSAEGVLVDAITLSDELDRRDQYKAVGGDEILVALCQAVPHVANAPYHAQIVRQKSISRQIAQQASETVRDAYSGMYTASELHVAVRSRIESVPQAAEPWPEITLAEAPEVLPFPSGVFPRPLRRYCEGVALVTQSPIDLAGVAMLATASVAVGQSVNLCLKRTWSEAPCLYLINVADPGKSKSPALKLVVSPLVTIDRKLREETQLLRAAWEEAKKAAGKSAPSEGLPPPKRAVVKDITRETLVAVLAANPRGVLMNPDEATAWVGSFNQYKAKGTDRQFWLDIWASTPTSVDRENGNRASYVHCPLVTVVANLQPELLGSLSEERGRNDGFVDRILFSFPASFPPQGWTEAELDQGDETTWHAVIARLHSLPMYFDREKALLRPNKVALSPEAKEVWVSWYNAHAAEMSDPEAPDWTPGAWSKMKAYCGRFALILSRLRMALDPDSSAEELTRSPVEREDIEGAIKLVDYFKMNLARVQHRLTGGVGNREADAILGWIKRKGVVEFREADVRADLRRRFPDLESMRPAISALVNAAVIRPKTPPIKAGRSGRPPSRTYLVNPALRIPIGAPENAENTENPPPLQLY
jgi:hypothetical protein